LHLVGFIRRNLPVLCTGRRVERKHERAAMVEMTSTGENRSTQTEPVSAPLCPPQIP